MGRGRGRGRGGGRGKRMVTSADDLELRNEQQAAFQARRAARRGEAGESGSDDEEAPEDADRDAQLEAMRAARQGNDEPKKAPKKKGAAAVIKTANPNGPQTHVKMSALANVKPELTRREREEIEKQRKQAAYQKRHAEGKTDEFKGDMERLKQAKARREAQEALVKKDSAEEERQKLLAAAANELCKGAQDFEREGRELAKKLQGQSFFEKVDDAPPKLNKIKVKKMKPAQLKEELKLRGLDIQGTGKQLLARLIEAAC